MDHQTRTEIRQLHRAILREEMDGEPEPSRGLPWGRTCG